MLEVLTHPHFPWRRGTPFQPPFSMLNKNMKIGELTDDTKQYNDPTITDILPIMFKTITKNEMNVQNHGT